MIRTASYYNNIILVNELLKDIRVLKNLDEKPICIAAKYGYDEIVKMFLRVPNNNWAEYAIISSLNNGYYHTSLFLLPKIKNHKEVILLSTLAYNQGIQDDKKLLVCLDPLRLTRNLSNFEIAERNKILSLIAEKII